METQAINRPDTLRKMHKRAFRTYSLLAMVIYSLATIYCYVTEHFWEARAMSVALLGIIGLIVTLYTTSGYVKEPNKMLSHA